MGKVYSKAAKRRAKKGLPGLAEVPKRQRRGKRRQKEIEDDARKSVLQARCRAVGLNPNSARDRRTVSAQIYGDPVGQALALSGVKGPEAYHDTFSNALKACLIFHRSVGVSLHAKTAKIEFAIERFEARPDDPPADMRTDDERDRAAQIAWDRWRNLIDGLTLGQSAAIHGAMRGWGTFHVGGELTLSGRKLVEALQALHDADQNA